MLDILKSAAGKSLFPLLAWIFPSALTVLAVWFVTLPMMKAASWSVPGAIESLSGAAAISWLTGVSIALGVVLNVISTPLYRLLEGYSWPKSLRKRAVAWQTGKYEALRAKVVAGIPGQQWEESLARERLARYPADPLQIAPTGFANALRSFETYGNDRFSLDSQILWTELWSVAPEQTRVEYEGARAFVDLFVATFYLSLLFMLLSLALLLVDHDYRWPALLTVLAPLGLAVYCYRMANVASTSWSATVQALVNIGRKPLAESLGLELPGTLADERRMWTAVVGYAFYGPANGAAYGKELDEFRKVSPAPPSNPTGSAVVGVVVGEVRATEEFGGASE